MRQLLGPVALGLILTGCARSPAGAAPGSAGRLAPAEGSQANAPANGTPAVAGSGTVYVANEGSASISAVDVASGRVRSVRMAIAPHNVQISADGAWLLAVGSPGDREGEGMLLVMHPQDLERPSAFIPVGNEPAHVVVDRAGQRAYVTNAADDTVAVVDLAEERTIDAIAVCDGPHGLRMSPDEREIWVACSESDEVGIVDVARGEMVERVAVGLTPVQVGFTPDGRRVYVSLSGDDTVAVVDAATREVRSRVLVGRSPIQLHASPDGRRVYVANQGTGSRQNHTVSVIDTATDTVETTIQTGAGAHGVAVSADGSMVFVTNTFAGTLSMIDAREQRVVWTVEVGERPGGVTWSPVTEGGARAGVKVGPVRGPVFAHFDGVGVIGNRHARACDGPTRHPRRLP